MLNFISSSVSLLSTPFVLSHSISMRFFLKIPTVIFGYVLGYFASRQNSIVINWLFKIYFGLFFSKWINIYERTNKIMVVMLIMIGT